MALHRDVNDPDIHEPKGASTASAGMIYVASGSGSGAWTYSPTGYVRYEDNSGPVIYGTTPQKISIDGTGSNSTDLYLPREIRGTGQSLWDVVADKIVPIRIGDAYTTRVNIPITAQTGSPTVLTMVLDIGGAAGITIPILTSEIPLTKTAPFSISETINFDTLDTFQANGGQLFLSVNSGTVTVTNPTVQITRTHGEIV